MVTVLAEATVYNQGGVKAIPLNLPAMKWMVVCICLKTVIANVLQ